MAKRSKRIFHKPFMDQTQTRTPPDTPPDTGACRGDTEGLAQAAQRLNVDPYALEERAAIYEYEAQMSRGEAERAAIEEMGKRQKMPAADFAGK